MKAFIFDYAHGFIKVSMGGFNPAHVCAESAKRFDKDLKF